MRRSFDVVDSSSDAMFVRLRQQVLMRRSLIFWFDVVDSSSDEMFVRLRQLGSDEALVRLRQLKF